VYSKVYLNVYSKVSLVACHLSFSVQVTEWIKGKPLDEVVKIKNSEIAKHLSLPPVKLHCSMLAEDAIKVCVCMYVCVLVCATLCMVMCACVCFTRSKGMPL